ncbi:MAG: hypothetical protein ACFBSD_08185 [Paracoccaceae bacterium]
MEQSTEKPSHQPLAALMAALGAIFAAEARAGGTDAYQALSKALGGLPAGPFAAPPDPAALDGALADPKAAPLCRIVAEARDWFCWRSLEGMEGVAETRFIGPTSPYPITEPVVGLVLVSQGGAMRRDGTAEETLFLLAGTGIWTGPEGRNEALAPTRFLHRPAGQDLACRAETGPVLAAFRQSATPRG